MYLIITDNEKLVENARRLGAAIFDSERGQPESPKTQNVLNKEEEIVNIMTRLAIKPDLVGYDYIKYILQRCANDPTYHKLSMTKDIYPTCALHFGTTESRVERGIFHAIEVGYGEVPERYCEIFKRELKSKPKNSEFISMISEILAIRK